MNELLDKTIKNMGKEECAIGSKKICYSERETRLIVAWSMISFSAAMFIFWAIRTTGYMRPAYVVDLLLPALLALTGIYILKRKIIKATVQELT